MSGLLIIVLGVVVIFFVVLDLGREVSVRKLTRRVVTLERQPCTHADITATQPHPPPSPGFPRHGELPRLIVIRTDTAEAPLVASPAQLPATPYLSDVDVPTVLDQRPRPRPIRVSEITARHRAPEQEQES
jgi:hypothetical protein